MPRYKCPLVSGRPDIESEHPRKVTRSRQVRARVGPPGFVHTKVEGPKQDSMFDQEEDGNVGSHITSEILERAHSARKRRSKPHKARGRVAKGALTLPFSHRRHLGLRS